MRKRIKELFERIAYAGLKPQGGVASPAAPAKSQRFAGIRASLEAQLTKSSSSDPLYLSNRTLSQKVKAWSILAAPAVLTLGGLTLALLGYFNKDSAITRPPSGMSNAEIADKMLPDLSKGLHVESQHDLYVEDVHVVVGAPVHLMGVARNNTAHEIANAELVFDLTDQTGSHQGAVTTEIKNIASKSSKSFDVAIEESSATFALVREIHVH
jgi:hypothetical protein